MVKEPGRAAPVRVSRLSLQASAPPDYRSPGKGDSDARKSGWAPFSHAYWLGILTGVAILGGISPISSAATNTISPARARSLAELPGAASEKPKTIRASPAKAPSQPAAIVQRRRRNRALHSATWMLALSRTMMATIAYGRMPAKI